MFKTVEERLKSGDVVLASIIREEFAKINAKIRGKKTIYWIIHKGTDYHTEHSRAIIRGSQQSGPKQIYEYLKLLNKRLESEKEMGGAAMERARRISSGNGARDKTSLIEYLFEKLHEEFPALTQSAIGKALFYVQQREVLPWLYEANELMRNAEEGKQPIDKKYNDDGFFMYMKLLRFVYNSLMSSGRNQKDAFKILAPLIQLKPHSLFDHIRRIEPPRKNNYRRKGSYSRLIHFIKQNLVTVVDLSEAQKFESSLDKCVSIDGNQRRMLVLMKKDYSVEDVNDLLQCIYSALNPSKKEQIAKFDNPESALALSVYCLGLNSRLKGYQISFVFDQSKLEEAILSFRLPNQRPTPYIASPANRTL